MSNHVFRFEESNELIIEPPKKKTEAVMGKLTGVSGFAPEVFSLINFKAGLSCGAPEGDNHMFFFLLLKLY